MKSQKPCLLNLQTVFMLLAAAVFCLLVRPAAAAPRAAEQLSTFDKARYRLTALAEADPVVSDLGDWEKAVQGLKEILESELDGARRAEALFILGESNRRMYDSRGYLPGLARAAYSYQTLLDESPQSQYAEEALYRLGVLKEEGFGSAQAAEDDLTKLVTRFPNGRFTPEARAKLQRLAADREAGREGLADLAAEERAESAWAPGARAPVIVIDPGHGGEDLGAVGINGVLEKDVTLNIATYLNDLLRERLRAKTVLTRFRDVVVPLQERTRIANEANADLFVSIHTNASPSHAVFGIETYYLDNTEDRSSLKLAERENLSIAFGGGEMGDLAFILSDLIQNAKLDDSISLAHHVQDALHKTLGQYFTGVRGLGVKRAPFYVLVGAHMPCVLAEVAFIDHPIEGARLIQPRYQRLVAEALFKGIQAFFLRSA